MLFLFIIKYIPLQQGLRLNTLLALLTSFFLIIKYIPLQQGLRHTTPKYFFKRWCIIKYIPLQQGLRHNKK